VVYLVYFYNYNGYKVIPEKYISIFTSDELELLLNGQPFIDLLDWKDNTIYSGGYSSSSRVITIIILTKLMQVLILN